MKLYRLLDALIIAIVGLCAIVQLAGYVLSWPVRVLRDLYRRA
jgi:hypothetical protein